MGNQSLTSRYKYFGNDSTENQNYHEYTAARAKDQIDPEAVSAAIEKVKTTFDEQLKAVGDALKNISQDADQSQVVSGTSMGPTIDETAEYISGLGPQLYDGIDEIYTQAVSIYNELQEAYNQYAKEAVVAEGVSSPSQAVVE